MGVLCRNSEFEVEEVPIFGTCSNLISVGSESDCNLVLIRHETIFVFAANFQVFCWLVNPGF